jgi:sterol desaturase/sphingolipid hydroxylase (fatty acid hydroxylase superfamily)
MTLHYPDVVNMAVPLFVVLILAEFTYIKFSGRGGRYETRDAVTSLVMGAGSVIAGILLGFIAWRFFNWVWQFRLFDLGTSLWVVALCFILDDLRYYWVHRLGHISRWAWAAHVNHHSSQHYNLTTALRQSWTSTFTGLMVLAVPLLLLGFHPAMVLFVGGLNLIYQFWIHTEAITKLPRLIEAVFNTPSHHRVHHGRNARYLDANYAGVLIIWDKLFGTFVPEDAAEPVDYGLVQNLGTFNPLRVAFHEWIGIARDLFQPGLTWRDRLFYAFAPPGWSHDGSRDTSKIIKSKWAEQHPEQVNKPGL